MIQPNQIVAQGSKVTNQKTLPSLILFTIELLFVFQETHSHHKLQRVPGGGLYGSPGGRAGAVRTGLPPWLEGLVRPALARPAGSPVGHSSGNPANTASIRFEALMEMTLF